MRDASTTTLVVNALVGPGHMNPLVSLCCEALDRGLAAKFIVGEPNESDVRKLFGRDVEDVLVVVDDPSDFDELVEITRASNYQLRVVDFNSSREAPIEAATREIMARAPGPVAGVADFMSLAAARAWRRLGVPYYVSMPGPPTILGLMGCDVPLSGEEWIGYLMMKLSSTAAFRSEQLGIALREMYAHCVGVFCSSIDPSILESSWSCFRTKMPSKVHLIRTFAAYEKPVDESVVAPFFLGDAEEEKPIILVSFGTLWVHSLTVHGTRELYKGLRRGKDEWRVVWKVSERQIFDEAVGDQEEEEDWLMVVDWIPQLALLKSPRVACFLNHCGWNGLTEAFATATPVLAAPIGGDQPVNSVFAAKLGVAAVLDSADRNAGIMAVPALPRVREEERFDEREVYAKLKQILDPQSSYQTNARKLKDIAFSSSDEVFGPVKALDIIERNLLLAGTSSSST